MRYSEDRQKGIVPTGGELPPPTRNPRRPKPSPRQGAHTGIKVAAVAVIGALLTAAVATSLGYFVAKPWAARLQSSVERDLQSGATELQLGTDEIHKANQEHNPGLLDDALIHFTKSRRSFRDASSRVGSEWALRGSADIPWLGLRYVKPRIKVVSQVATMGVALSDAGTETAGLDRQLLAPSNKDLPVGERLIGVLKSAAPTLPRIQADLARAASAADLVDSALLPSAQRQTFARTKAQIQSGLDGIGEFQRLSPVLLEILGANGARTYLIEQIDPAELRGAGGFIGSYSLLSADQGSLKLGKSGDVGAIDAPYPVKGGTNYIAPPNSTLQFTQHGWVFGDSNFSADFPTSARAGERLFLNETGTKVDGVISIDPSAVAALLQVTGPIAIPEYNTTAQASTFAEEVFQREEKVINQVPGRKNFFPAVADRLIDKIAHLPSDAWPPLLNVLNNSVQARHLQVYFNNEMAEVEMGRISWAGSMVTPTSDRELLLEVESNLGGTKANHFVERNYDLTLSAANGKLGHHLVINLKNSTPPGYPGGRVYNGYLRLYYPLGATDALTTNLERDRYPSDENPAAAKLADGWIYVEIKNQKLGYATFQVVIDYTTDLRDAASTRQIYWQKQAGTLSDKVHISYQVGGGTYTADTDLGQDRLITLSPKGLEVKAGYVPTARLPILG